MPLQPTESMFYFLIRQTKKYQAAFARKLNLLHCRIFRQDNDLKHAVCPSERKYNQASVMAISVL